MRRREFITLVGGAAAWPLAARAQQPGRMRRIGVLNDSGGAGAVSTAADYLRFSQMLLNGGQLDGMRILSRTTVELMTSDHLDHPIMLMNAKTITTTTTASINFTAVSYRLPYAIVLSMVRDDG